MNNIYDTHTAQNTHNNNTTTAATPPTTTTTNHTLSRRKSVAIFDQITLLERENCLLKSQLDESSLTKQELDQSSQRTISSLRKANTKLQADLVAALTNQRDGKSQNNRVVVEKTHPISSTQNPLQPSPSMKNKRRDTTLQDCRSARTRCPRP